MKKILFQPQNALLRQPKNAILFVYFQAKFQAKYKFFLERNLQTKIKIIPKNINKELKDYSIFFKNHVKFLSII